MMNNSLEKDFSHLHYRDHYRQFALAFFMLALAVAMGAIGAHALKDNLTPKAMETFQTGVRFHLFHSLALILLTLIELKSPPSSFSFLTKSFWSIFIGILLFSGNCYLYAISSMKVFALIVPVGGILWIGTWLWVSIKFFMLSRPSAKKLLFFLLLPTISLITSCSHRYEKFHALDKHNFSGQFTTSHNAEGLTPSKTKLPRSPNRPLKKENSVQILKCSNQWFFFNNALTDAKKNLEATLPYTCSKARQSDFILDARVDESWWTLLFFSRGCYEVRGFCAQ